MASSVATPLEREFSAIAGVDSITSTSGLGNGRITIQFILTRNIDAAAQDVQAAIANAAKKMPVEMTTPPSYRKVNPGVGGGAADDPHLGHAAALDARRIRRGQYRAAAVHAGWRGAGHHLRSAEICRSGPGRSRAAGGPRHRARRGAKGAAGRKLEHAGGRAQRASESRDPAGQHPAHQGGELRAADHRLSQRGRGAAARRRPRSSTASSSARTATGTTASAPSRSRSRASPTPTPSRSSTRSRP